MHQPPAAPPPQAPAGAPFVADMTPGDKLIKGASGAARAVGQTAAGLQTAGNAGVTGIQNAILGARPPSAAANLAGAAGVGSGGFAPLGGSRPGITASGAGVAPGVMPTAAGIRQPATTPLSTGVGQGSLDAVDAALTGYDPSFAVPGTVSRGALPGATDRGAQLNALDAALAFDPQTASLAQQQLRDATQANLSQSLALARSARGGPAAQAAALRMAQAEGAATMSQQARDLAQLRAKEEDTAKARELEALGLGGELATGIRASDVTERGQNVSSLDNALTAGVAQRGQTIDARQAQSRAELDALLGRGQIAQAGRSAAVSERGQTLDATMQGESIKQARDAVAASALSDAEKTEAQVLINAGILNGQLTPEQQFRMQELANKADDPSMAQKVIAGIQAVGTLAAGVGSLAKGG